MSEANKYEKVVREKQKKDGFFDGRFRERVIRANTDDFGEFDLEEELTLYEDLYLGADEEIIEDIHDDDSPKIVYEDKGF